MVGVTRRLWLGGLRDATVRFAHEPGTAPQVRMLRNPQYPYVVGDYVAFAESGTGAGAHLCARGVTGDLLISW